METKLSSGAREIVIQTDGPTVLIGERINPAGKKKMAQALSEGAFDYLRREAAAQVEAGADIIDVNVGVSGLDEAELMVRAVETVMAAVDAPLCLDSNSSKALRAGLEVYQGKALINSVSAEKRSLRDILPLVKEFGAAVIALPMDENGIPDQPGQRLELARKIRERTDSLGIPAEDVVFDGLAMTVGADTKAGLATLETIRLIKAQFGANMTLGVSNISFGIPNRPVLNRAFLALAVFAGVNCPVVDAAQVRETVLAVDLARGRDEYARRYLRAYRQGQAQ